MHRGFFCTFEGVDGCGKTTQLRLLAHRLRTAGLDVVETVEPGGTDVGNLLRAILLEKREIAIAARTELLLYFANRAQNAAEVIEPGIDRGAIVLCDRFTDSTLAYQGAGRGLEMAEIQALHRIACGTLTPDLTLLLDIDLATSLERARRRNRESGSTETRIDEENRAFFERVRDGYRNLASSHPARIRVIDARDAVDAVAARVQSALEPFLNQRRN